jgi:hypothetical protein
MIKMTKGIYAHNENGLVVDKTPESAPFQLSKAAEAELVAKGCATYVDTSKQVSAQKAQKRDRVASEGRGGDYGEL